MERLLEIMARLRSPEGGCPWDLEQTFETIAPHTLEEAYEVLDAIERGDYAELRDELGDLLLQVVFHAQLAREAGHFDFHDVAEALRDKLVRRHPHVFGEARIESAGAQTEAWEAQKAVERAARSDGAPPGALDGVARALPALLRAAKLQRRAARAGFDWEGADAVLAKLHEELAEVAEARDSGDADALEEELGDLLFVAANLARALGVEPEQALRRANRKFEARFRAMEAELRERGGSFPALEPEAQRGLWRRAKQRLKSLESND